MPKQIFVHPNEGRKTHPLRLAWAKQTHNLSQIKKAIMKATGWSEATFYRHVVNDMPLTEAEAQAICAHLPGLQITAIDSFQNGFAVGRNRKQTA